MKKNVIIVILGIIILGLSGYLVYDKVLLDSGNKLVDNNAQEEKEESYDLEAAKKLIDKYYAIDIDESDIFNEGYTDRIMKYLAVQNVAIKDIGGINCNTLYSNNEIRWDSDYKVILDNGKITYCPVRGAAETISYDVLSESYKKLFGNDKKLSKGDFNYSLNEYDYNETKDIFVIMAAPKGLDEITKTIYDIQSALKIKNKLIIKVGMAQLNLDGSYWKTTVSGLEITYSSEDVYDYPSFREDFLNKYLDKLDTYTFTFFEEDGIYKLEGMIKEKN